MEAENSYFSQYSNLAYQFFQYDRESALCFKALALILAPSREIVPSLTSFIV